MSEIHYTVHPHYGNVVIPDREEWKDIAGLENCYQASTHGRIQSLSRMVWNQSKPYFKKGRVLKPTEVGKGYLEVVVGGIRRYVHHLVLETFIGSRPHRKVGSHYDGNPKNNRLENLRWATKQEDEHDKKHCGTYYRRWQKDHRGENNPKAKLTETQVREIRSLHALGQWSFGRLGRKFCVRADTISSIIRRETWKHI